MTPTSGIKFHRLEGVRDVTLAAVLSLATWFIFCPFAPLGVDSHHDGIMLKPALDVLSGQVLFRDTFTQYGPLTTYLHALALWVNPSLLALRLMTVGAYAGAVFFFYLSWRSILPASLATLAIGLFWLYAPFYAAGSFMMPWSSALALLFQSIAFCALMRVLAGGSALVWPWVLGIATACVLWCRQPVGILLVASLIVVGPMLHIAGWRHREGHVARLWARVALGFAAVTILVLGHIALYGAIRFWWEQNIVLPRRWVESEGATFLADSWWKYFRVDRAAWLSAALLLAFAPALLRRIKLQIPKSVDLVWVALLGLIYFLSTPLVLRDALALPQGGWSLLIVCAVAMFGTAVLVLSLWGGNRRRSNEFYAAASLAGLAIVSFAQLYPVADANHSFWAIPPAFGLFLYLVWRLTGLPQSAFAMIVIGVLCPVAADRVEVAAVNLEGCAEAIHSPAVLGGMKIEPAQAQAFRSLDEIFKRIAQYEPNAPAMVYGYDALYLTFVENRENPSPYYVNWPLLMSEKERVARYLFLEKRPVLLFHTRFSREFFDSFLRAVQYKIIDFVIDPKDVFVYVAVPIDMPIPVLGRL